LDKSIEEYQVSTHKYKNELYYLCNSLACLYYLSDYNALKWLRACIPSYKHPGQYVFLFERTPETEQIIKDFIFYRRAEKAGYSITEGSGGNAETETVTTD
jgi:hypothetical protein